MPEIVADTVRLSTLPTKGPTAFSLVPDASALGALASDLDLLELRKVRFEGQLTPAGKRDWTLTGKLGATVVQPCAITLDPVTTRIETPVSRSYVADYVEPDAVETEMPEDDSIDPLPETLSLRDVMIEALDLALPLFPRADGAEMSPLRLTEPGKRAMTDDEAKPFAGLAALRQAMTDKDEDL